ncbi:MAG: saccharopine dehydrogenase-like oxidoreductase [bacterium]
MRIGILGAGGLGRTAAQIIEMKEEMKLVAICDRRGFAFSPEGLSAQEISGLKPKDTVAEIKGGRLCDDPIREIVSRGAEIDGIFVTLPNMPNDFIPGVIQQFIQAKFKGVFVDCLKRTSAMELVFTLHEEIKKIGSTYLTGCGATPGLLTAAAVLAAQSFVRVEHIDIHWGVGISNWEQYKATIREDIAHLPGFTVEKAQALTDEEVKELLDARDGKLELRQMEHADDLMLERAGVVASRTQVEVGGIMDTRSAKKPVSTTMTLTGITFDGQRSSHRFILGDETTMAANVIGPALGYLKKAAWLNEKGIYGVYASCEFMPAMVA